MATRTESYPLQHWIPYKLRTTNGQPDCRWLYLGDHPMTAPFFDDTQQRCLSHPYNSSPYASVSSLDGLIEMAQAVPAVAPTAFIFHVSRCGSTLLGQLLSLLTNAVVLSEVPILDALLRLPTPVDSGLPSPADQAFVAALQLLSQQRTGREAAVFIKTDSWHLLQYGTLRRLYPKTPFILLYRSPDEVLRSQRNRRGMQAIPGLIPPAFFGFTTDPNAPVDLDAYMAMVLERYFEVLLMIAKQDSNCLLIDYQADGMVMMNQLIRFLDLTPDADVYAAMAERCGYHGKYPGQLFGKEPVVSECPEYLQPAMTLYHQLNALL
ncbi:sulfotransferase family protein [Spirosoma utsteinense]|uniref:Sulfotransferase family protein n=1 Tax=Spirosoma utsteinense TaxID=2585773 RepID=A0ABR6WE40_9BACT|nr:sulfotransferase family protein [Spirosoma utsteinense]MBC3788358.1 hypothetical protein [Spirosoma utsteinense]MBC3794275.1 hypothetical protein [Spirosoma utsteinense]